jgi:hypothetical protein
MAGAVKASTIPHRMGGEWNRKGIRLDSDKKRNQRARGANRSMDFPSNGKLIGGKNPTRIYVYLFALYEWPKLF